jgi:N-terminal domain of toast_rack, DUF2154
MQSRRVRVGALAVVTMVAVGCVDMDRPEGPVQQTSQSVELGGARAVSVDVSMGAGELQMHGGLGALMDASFRYRSPEVRPEVKYNVVGEHGRLIIRSPREVSTGNHDSRWDLRLKEDVPLDITVRMGAGAGRLDLADVDLRNLQIDMGVGELKLDLSGKPKHDVDVRVHGGVGEATIRLPHSAAVDVRASGGIGGIHVSGLEKRGDKYVNAAYDTAKVAMHVEVHGGIPARF